MSDIAFYENDFCNMSLEECLVSFKMYEDGKKYIYVLWNMVFVIRIGIICRYFVEYGSCT